MKQPVSRRALLALALAFLYNFANAQISFQADVKHGKGIWGDVYGFHIANELLQCEDGNVCREWADSLKPVVYRFPSGGHAKFIHLVEKIDSEWVCKEGWGYNYEEIEDLLIKIYLSSYGVDSLWELAIDSLYPGVFNPDPEINSCFEEEADSWVRAANQQIGDPPYFCDFIAQMQSLQAAGVPVQIVYCANLFTATPEENIAVINKMLEAGLTVGGIEMGNEMFYGSKPTAGLVFKGDEGNIYKDCTGKKKGDPDKNGEDAQQGADAAQAYYDYINGVFNENTKCWLYEFQEYEHLPDTGILDNNKYCTDTIDMENDYIAEFRTNFPNIKIGVSCTAPAISGYQTIHNGTQDYHNEGEQALFAGWDSLLGLKYNDIRIINDIPHKTFDAYIAHPYFDSRIMFIKCVEDFVNNDANTWEDTLAHISYQGIENDALDERLADAFICGREEFMNYINYGFEKYWDYYTEKFKFTTPGNSKTIWFTEWSILGRTNYFLEDDDYVHFDPDNAGTSIYNSDIFYNTFLQSSIIFNWQHKLIERALSASLVNFTKRGSGSRVEYATFHSMFNEKPLGPISQKLDLDEPNSFDNPDVFYKNNQRKRITYYSFDLLKDIYAEELKWVPLNISTPGTDSVNFHLFGYLDNTDDHYLYIYFDNTDSLSKSLNLTPTINGKNKQDKTAQKHIKYFKTNQLYSGNGYSPILGHNEYYHADSGYYAPVSVNGFIEFDTNAVVFDIPKYAQGYIKIPLKESITGKYADEMTEEANDPCSNFSAYYNMQKNEFYFQDLSDATGEINLYVLDILGRPVIEKELNEDEEIIHFETLPAGMYVYAITGETGTCSNTFVISK